MTMAKNDISELRKQLETLDSEIFKLLEQRMAAAKKIGEIKKATGMPIHDAAREALNLQKNLKITEKKLPSLFVEEVTQLVAKWAKMAQGGHPPDP